MNVSAIIVTRGNVDLDPIRETISSEWEFVVWDNGAGEVRREWIPTWADPGNAVPGELDRMPVLDMAVYGRYEAIEVSSGDVIYVQDDDVIVSDPEEIVNAWLRSAYPPAYPPEPFGRTDHVVCNMPPEFRHDFYDDHALVGFGAAFYRYTPERAFSRFALSSHRAGAVAWGTDGCDRGFFDRTCDIVFTGLTPRVLVDVPIEHAPYATGPDRMYRQPEHVAERQRMRELVRSARATG